MAYDSECIFCRIAAGLVPAEVVRSSERVVALRDLNPQAPSHVLVIPREHYPDVGALAAEDPQTLAELVTTAADVAKQEANGGFRLVFNTGAIAGQSVFHVHGHVLAGRAMAWPPG